MMLLRNKFLFVVFTVLPAALSFPSHAPAQTVLLNPPQLYIGTTYGINGSMLLFNPNVAQSYLMGHTGGLSIRYVTEKHFGLQVEFNYSQRGWREKGDMYARQFNYVEMPFLTHAYMGDKNRLFLNIGPKVSYLLNEITVKNTNTESTAEQHVQPARFKIDYGGCVGLGYHLHTKHMGVFQFEVRGYYGLADVLPNAKSDYFNTSNHFNVAASLGWYFQLTGRQ